MNLAKHLRALAAAGLVFVALALPAQPAPASPASVTGTATTAVGTATVASADDIPHRQRQSPAAVRVVSVNIRHDFAADFKSGDSWDRRRELARDVLLAQDADIFCFQELRLNIYDYLKENLPGFAAFYGVAEASKNAVFYSAARFEEIEGRAYWLSETPDIPFSHLPKSGDRLANRILLRDKLTGRQFLVWNAHLQHDNADVRDRQAAILVDLAQKDFAAVPQIWTADFNADIKEKTIQRIFAAGWLDSYAGVHGPADPGFTFHGFAGKKYKKNPGIGKIDFVFHNALLRPTAAEVIRDSRAGRYPSDHFFVSAEFEYEK
jgi:endonuclease/exonuclease/phosphatase family metal-dependent hydrolase